MAYDPNRDAGGFRGGLAGGLVAVTPHDTNELPTYAAGLYVGGTGNVRLRTPADAAPVTLTAVPGGALLPIRTAQVYATGTTATSIIALT